MKKNITSERILKETKGTNILVVDDRPENLLAMEALLADLDLNLMSASSGQDALAQMLDCEFAVILLDVQMPDMDGFEVAELMKTNERTRHIPIIFVTAISKGEEHVFRGYDTGAVDYLFKPLDPHIVRSKVSVFLELNQQKKALERLSEELRHSIGELTTVKNSLEQANRTIVEQQKSVIAEERMKAILQMANATAHEMNQPLTVILGNIELMKRNKNESSNMERFISNIEEAGVQLSDIIKRILSIQRDATKRTGGGTMFDLTGKNRDL